MISSIVWVPKGIADPSPKKYELSAAEKEIVELMESQGLVDDDAKLEETATKLQLRAGEKKKDAVDDDDDKEATATTKTTSHGLPADLRMDEYSSDEDENDDENEALQGAVLGGLLMEKPGNEYDMGKDSDKDNDDEDQKMDASNSDEEDEDDDDHIDDIPDTREFEPIDVDGMDAMGLGQVGMNAPLYMDGEEFDDDDSDAEDVRINQDDALIVIAKTEDVSLLCGGPFCSFGLFLT